jgi:hypothetical protein
VHKALDNILFFRNHGPMHQSIYDVGVATGNRYVQ